MEGVHVLVRDWWEYCSVVGEEKHLTIGAKGNYRQQNGETRTKSVDCGPKQSLDDGTNPTSTTAAHACVRTCAGGRMCVCVCLCVCVCACVRAVLDKVGV
jgi:hypothetical protein